MGSRSHSAHTHFVLRSGKQSGGEDVRSSEAEVVVYIVDDDPAVRDGFARLLRSAGLDARPCDSVELFLAEVENLPKACILLDITMPTMTGPEVQEELRLRNILLPVIAVSARDDKHTQARTRGLGAKLFLHKPVDDQALLDAISWVTTNTDRLG